MIHNTQTEKCIKLISNCKASSLAPQSVHAASCPVPILTSRPAASMHNLEFLPCFSLRSTRWWAQACLPSTTYLCLVWIANGIFTVWVLVSQGSLLLLVTGVLYFHCCLEFFCLFTHPVDVSGLLWSLFSQPWSSTTS